MFPLKKECPICTSDAHYTKDTLDGHTLLESYLTCKSCGYYEEYTYGHTRLSFVWPGGKTEEFIFNYNDTNEETDKRIKFLYGALEEAYSKLKEGRF